MNSIAGTAATERPAIEPPTAGLAITTTVSREPADGTQVKGSSAVSVLVGRFDAVEAPLVREELSRIIDAGTRTVVVDLSAVSFIDSAGLAALVRARRDTQRSGGDIILISPSEYSALRVFRLTQFDDVFRMVKIRADE